MAFLMVGLEEQVRRAAFRNDAGRSKDEMRSRSKGFTVSFPQSLRLQRRRSGYGLACYYVTPVDTHMLDV